MKKCFVCGAELPEIIIEKLGTSIKELGLSNRALNCLTRAEIEYVEQLIKLTDIDLLRIRKMGVKTITEIKEKVKVFGFDY